MSKKETKEKKPRKHRRKISVKVEEEMVKSKTREKISELSYSDYRLPSKMRFALTEIRRELGINGKIEKQNIEQINGMWRYWRRNKKKLLNKRLPWEFDFPNKKELAE